MATDREKGVEVLKNTWEGQRNESVDKRAVVTAEWMTLKFTFPALQ